MTWSRDQTLRLWGIDENIRTRCQETVIENAFANDIFHKSIYNELTQKGNITFNESDSEGSLAPIITEEENVTQSKYNESNGTSKEYSIRTQEEQTQSKSVRINTSDKRKISDSIKALQRIPYHRTSGARFCPNGQILGE